MTKENQSLKQKQNPSPKISLAGKRAFLVSVRDSLTRKYQQILGQIELIDEMSQKGVNIEEVEIDNTEGIVLPVKE